MSLGKNGLDHQSLVDHYCLTELKMDSHAKKAYSTKKRTSTYLEKWILPRWGEYRPGDIKSVAVEEWLDGLVHDYREEDRGKPLANGTKVKFRNIMSAVFRHGMRYEFLPRVEEANPMKYVRQAGNGRVFRSFSKSSNFSGYLRHSNKESGPWCCWIAERDSAAAS